MSELKKITTSNYDDCLRLGENAFNYTLTQAQIEDRKWQMNKQDIYGIFDGEKLAAKLHLHSFQVTLNEQIINMGGIAGVATWPEDRRKGYVGALMKHALRIMYEQGTALSMLHPFSIPFYRNYGFELTQHTYTYKGKLEHLITSTASENGKLKRIHKEDAARLLNPVYEQAASDYMLMLKREQWWWERRVISENTQIIAYEANGRIEGYLLAEMKKDRLVIEEFIYQSTEAFTGLLQWMKNHDSMTSDIELSMLPGDLDAFHFSNPSFKEVRKPYFMARIVDVVKFFEEYPFVKQGNGSLKLKLTDHYAPWNEGVWVCTLTDGNMEVEKTTGDADIEMDIRTLSAVLSGSLSLEKAAFMNKLSGESVSVTLLASWLPKNNPAFLDFF
ncbi:acetyltransferase [Thalassobacillus devorans]|uniref:Acetyltransferase n=1 Tax=Thalassobacillus devorans TaxID=279813 RepID=A0ABQ1NR05_9BACI|nr:GNAT family N-acetyltransferase [Thalassobacillus devorans]NIK27778.1 putative acetyltransferase [Thalassobacillus devorans]GGC80364.1 acetyltransferase [Thalassobacillus devorans]